MRPQLVTDIKQGNRVVQSFEPIVLREQICSPSTLETMQECLEGVMINGTGKNLKSTFFKTAGKTGTAQIANRNLGYGKEGEKKHIASFAGYFPADDPIYSCIVVIAAPTDDIYGATVSGTVFSAIANKVYATSLEYHKAINEKPPVASMPSVMNGYRYDVNQVLNRFAIAKEFQGNNEWVVTTKRENDVKIADAIISKEKIPNVKGMGLKDAIYLIEKIGMYTHISGSGKVISQSIPAGTEVVPGGVVYLELK